jgi:hypothetical protein
MDPGERVVALSQWFRTRYAPPGSHATLANYDNWLADDRQPDNFATADRGPVEAIDVLSEKFGSILDEEFLQKAADILDRESTEWIRVPDGEELEQDFEIKNEPSLSDEDSDGLFSMVSYSRRELRDVMPEDATPEEREQIERLLGELLARVVENDPAIESALGDESAARALVLERIRLTREAGERLRKTRSDRNDGLPSRKHNNPPPDATEILAAAEQEIFERGLEFDLQEMEDNLVADRPNTGRLKRSAKQLLRWAASAALMVIRTAAADVRTGIVAVLVEDCLSHDQDKLLVHLQSLRAAANVLLNHLGVVL